MNAEHDAQMTKAEQIIAWFVYSEGKRRDEPRGVVPYTGAPSYEDAIAWLAARGRLRITSEPPHVISAEWIEGKAPWEVEG